jgi:hypothetical protein
MPNRVFHYITGYNDSVKSHINMTIALSKLRLSNIDNPESA